MEAIKVGDVFKKTSDDDPVWSIFVVVEPFGIRANKPDPLIYGLSANMVLHSYSPLEFSESEHSMIKLGHISSVEELAEFVKPAVSSKNEKTELNNRKKLISQIDKEYKKYYSRLVVNGKVDVDKIYELNCLNTVYKSFEVFIHDAGGYYYHISDTAVAVLLTLDNALPSLLDRVLKIMEIYDDGKNNKALPTTSDIDGELSEMIDDAMPRADILEN